MKKDETNPYNWGSLTDMHRLFGLPAPKHPLISLINGVNTQIIADMPNPHVLHYYKISYKPRFTGKLRYGQSYYDFDEGGLLFASPGQIIGKHEDDLSAACSEYVLLIHPDFLLHYPLAKKIRQYGFFSYATNEALHLSEEEKATIISIFKMIDTELNSRIDDFSQDVLISHIELFLNYSNRFYKRQFVTRKAVHNDFLQRIEDLLENYFQEDVALAKGLPSVQYLADQLNLSTSYLSDMLRSLVGQNAQQLIQAKLFEKAKELLSTTELSASEIAFQLGFEHSQSFSKFFKTKAKVSPLQFRQSFN